MSKLNVGDRVLCNEPLLFGEGTVINNLGLNYYRVKFDSGLVETLHSHKLILKNKRGDKMMNGEEKELKKDIEILLNIYLSNRDMNKKEIKRFSERHFDIIEKQNAKETLKKRCR